MDGVWNEAALRLLDVSPADAVGADSVADMARWLGCAMPAAVAEWFRTGADRRLAQVSDNHISGLVSPDRSALRLLEHGWLLLETDSQHCCRWVTPLDGGDDPIVYVVDPDDVNGESRTTYAESFTAYTEADVWDALLYRAVDAEWSFDQVIAADALERLGGLLGRRPITFAWAHNQGCDAVHRFDGAARVALATVGPKAVWTVSATADAGMRTAIADILGERS